MTKTTFIFPLPIEIQYVIFKYEHVVKYKNVLSELKNKILGRHLFALNNKKICYLLHEENNNDTVNIELLRSIMGPDSLRVRL